MGLHAAAAAAADAIYFSPSAAVEKHLKSGAAFKNKCRIIAEQKREWYSDHFCTWGCAPLKALPQLSLKIGLDTGASFLRPNWPLQILHLQQLTLPPFLPGCKTTRARARPLLNGSRSPGRAVLLLLLLQAAPLRLVVHSRLLQPTFRSH